MNERRFLKIPISIWDGISGLAGLIGISAVLLGGIFATLEYRDRKASSRAAETLNLIDIWETRGAQSAFQGIAVVLESTLDGVELGNEMSDVELERLKENLVRRVMIDLGPEAYETVMSYFTRLSLCIQSDLCSEGVANVFFSETVTDFHGWFVSEIESRRRLNPRHARELDWLVCRFSSKSETSSRRIGPSCN